MKQRIPITYYLPLNMLVGGILIILLGIYLSIDVVTSMRMVLSSDGFSVSSLLNVFLKLPVVILVVCAGVYLGVIPGVKGLREASAEFKK